MINFAQWTLNTMQPEIPGIYNANNTAIQRYLDVFWNDAGGIIIAPINTPGNVKAASGQFVNVVVDNLTVKNQFTNLYDNNTTADFNFYKMYIDPAAQPRDPCTAATWWPQEQNGLKYVDVNKPYYKIQNITQPYVFNNNNLSQVVGIFLDPSLVSPTNQFQVLLDPVGNTYFTADASAAGDPSMGTGFYVELIAVSYDPSYGTTWAQYKYGLPVVGTGGSGGGSGNGTVGPGTANTLAMFTGPTTVSNSPLSITGTDINTFAINADGIITLTNKKITGVATPTNPLDAVNLDYANQFSTNASIGSALAQFIRNTSVGNTLYWNAGTLDVSISLVGVSKFYVDGSLAKRDASIAQLYQIKANNASLGLYATISSLGTYATNASINTAGFAKNTSLGTYATNASVGLALGTYATNVSVGLAGFVKQTYVDGSLSTRDASITWLFNNTLNANALNPFATNASVGSALQPYITNVSLNAAGFTTNTSVNTALGVYATNSSVNSALEVLSLYILSASTGYGLVWDASGFLDVSIAGITDAASKSNVDTSIAAVLNYLNTSFPPYSYVINNFVKNASFEQVLDTYDFVTNTSVNYAFSNYYTKTYLDTNFITEAYVDGSLALQQLQIESLDNRVTVLEVSTGTASLAYVDGSLAVRDASITDLYNKFSIDDASVLTLTLDLSILDASIYALTLSSLTFATNASINAASFAKNSSVNYLYGWQVSQDASIDLIIGTNATQQSQINALQTRETNSEASINRLDSSVNWLMSQTSGEITTAYFDGSLATRDLEITDLYLTKADITYVDGSLSQRDASITWLFNNITPSSLTQVYVDGSLAIRDASITDLYQIKANNVSLGLYATNVSVGTAIAPFATNVSVGLAGFATNASIGLAGFATNASVGLAIQNFTTNTSIGLAGFAKNVSLSLYATNASIGLAGFATNTSVGTAIAPFATNVSVGLAIQNFTTNTSIGLAGFATNTSVGLAIQNFTTNVSVGLAIATFASNASVGIALGAYATNSSVNIQINQLDASILAIDTSLNSIINSLTLLLPDASIGTDFYWNGGLLNVSVNITGTTYDYVDGSLNNKQNQINALGFRITSLESSTGNVDFIYVDGSLAVRDASINFLFANKANNASLGIYATNASIGLAGFATNASVGLAGFIKNASLGLYATNASVGLALGAYTTNVSVGLAGFIKNASLGIYATNASIGLAGFVTNTSVNTAFSLVNGDIDTLTSQVGALNSSLNAIDASTRYWRTYVDGSLNKFIRNSSIGTGLYWDASGYLDVSTAGKNYDASIAYLNTQILQLDASIIAIDVSLNDTIDALSIFFPNASIGTGLAWSAGVLNVSVGAGVSSLAALSDASVSVSIADKSFLQFDTSIGKWRDASSLDAASYLQEKMTFGTKASAGTGAMGAISFDPSYLYICTSTNTWGRLLLTTGY